MRQESLGDVIISLEKLSGRAEYCVDSGDEWNRRVLRDTGKLQLQVASEHAMVSLRRCY